MEQVDRQLVENGADRGENGVQHGDSSFPIWGKQRIMRRFQPFSLFFLCETKTTAEPVRVRKRWTLRLFT